jgi:predicted DNA-binding protein with PD1-like motif
MENLEFIDVGIDNFDFSEEFDDSIEYDISENISLLYNKSTQKFTIEYVDQETFDEYIVDVEEPFEDMEIDGTVITKKDFEEFKELVLKSA